jgi:endoglucanase
MPALLVQRFDGVATLLRRCAHALTFALAAALLAPLPLLAAPREPDAGKEIPCFHRGVAIHNMMNWAAVEPSDPNRYAFPAFAGPNYETSDALLRNVAAAGFDFVRLTIDPGPFLQFTGAKREALDQHLKAVVDRLLRNGFCVIVDFHPTSQVAKYAPDKLVQGEDDPLFLAYAAVMANGFSGRRLFARSLARPPRSCCRSGTRPRRKSCSTFMACKSCRAI